MFHGLQVGDLVRYAERHTDARIDGEVRALTRRHAVLDTGISLRLANRGSFTVRGAAYHFAHKTDRAHFRLISDEIRCPRCGLVSHHPDDVRERFCSVCGYHGQRFHKLDKTDWPVGEWTDEPDEACFEYGGLRCLILRHELGFFCGYIRAPLKSGAKISALGGISVKHEDVGADGGLVEIGPAFPFKIFGDEPWIAFDGGHLPQGHAVPRLPSTARGLYCNLSYVKRELRRGVWEILHNRLMPGRDIHFFVEQQRGGVWKAVPQPNWPLWSASTDGEVWLWDDMVYGPCLAGCDAGCVACGFTSRTQLWYARRNPALFDVLIAMRYPGIPSDASELVREYTGWMEGIGWLRVHELFDGGRHDSRPARVRAALDTAWHLWAIDNLYPLASAGPTRVVFGFST